MSSVRVVPVERCAGSGLHPSAQGGTFAPTGFCVECGHQIGLDEDRDYVVRDHAGYVLARGVTSATPIGTPVHFKDALGEFDSVTRSAPWQIGNGEWIVALEGHSGGYGIEFLTVLDTPNCSQGGEG